jgi:hypothetical protein
MFLKQTSGNHPFGVTQDSAFEFDCLLLLGEHPKPATREHLKTGHL